MAKRYKIYKEEKLAKKICEVQNKVEYLSEAKIKKVLKEQTEKGVITDYAYILHDKDIDDYGKLKDPHYHLYLRFKDTQPFERVAKWFNIEIGYVRIIKTNYNQACAYLVHRNDPDKFQYDPSEVVSSFDYLAFLDSMSEKEKAKMKDEDYVKKIKEQIFEEVQNGTLRGYNFHEKYNLTERLRFRGYLDKVVLEVTKAKVYANEERNLEVIYIHGTSGSGKTSYAKEIAKRRNFYYAISAEDRDPLESYDGQPCLILDEARPTSMKLANFLKLVDNNTESKGGARYHGKVLLECKLIIITSILGIDEFFEKLQENDRETAIQIKRRCKTKLKMDIATIYIERWDDLTRRYIDVGNMENPIPKLYHIEKKEIYDLQIETADVLGLGAMEFAKPKDITEKCTLEYMIWFHENKASL